MIAATFVSAAVARPVALPVPARSHEELRAKLACIQAYNRQREKGGVR